MGAISIEQFLPSHIFRPDDASPISKLGFPSRGRITRIGFDRKPGQPLKFEGETLVEVRMAERTWRYKLKGPEKKEPRIRESRRWRLEILINAKNSGPIEPSHHVVVAQTPYGNGWVQSAALKKYTKKHVAKEDIESKLPVFDDLDDIELKLEAAHVYDPWETGEHYVAGISFPQGYLQLLSGNPRNSAIDYVIGICPDFEATRNELLLSTEIENLTEMTRKDEIAFWKRGAPDTRPRLYERTKDTASNLMMLSIHQALAGPRELSKKWQDKPVWKLVEHLYCNHLNNANRKNSRKPKEKPFSD